MQQYQYYVVVPIANENFVNLVSFQYIVNCSATCLNGGTCNMTTGQCLCTEEWTGYNCQIGEKHVLIHQGIYAYIPDL